MDNVFSYLLEKQAMSHCGACSLSYCLYVLGIERSQKQVARDTGSPWMIYFNGLEPEQIARAAARNNAKCHCIESDSSRKFLGHLDRHLDNGNPAILLVEDSSHWVAVIGLVRHKGKMKYVVDDPVDKDRFFFLMDRNEFLEYAWNDEDCDSEECLPYMAILVRRRDGKPGVWRPTHKFLDLCGKGSYGTALEMASDLRDIVKASGGASRTKIGLSKVLRDERRTMVKSLKWIDWERAASDKDEMMEFFDDYAIVADAACIECPSNIDRPALMSQVTALLVTCAWCGQL